MMKLAMICALVCLVNGQRPPFAGKTNRHDVVLPQYRPEENNENVANVANRIGEESSTTPIPLDLPVDALGDINLVNRIKTWPRDKQPFWFINWQQIQAHRGDTRTPDQVTQPLSHSTKYSTTD